MSSGSDGKPPSGSQPGRPAAETPQRLVVRSGDGNSSTGADLSADTAVASRQSMAAAARAETPVAGMPALVEMVGATLSGRYLVIRKIGQGGMGAVYEATHTAIGKRVAVKVLLEKYARREAIVARLKKEAQLASSVQNEHIIDVTDFGQTDDGRTFVVMEFLEGESLAECLARETRLPEQRVLRIAQQAASALSAAHASGIVHRDIKPENLFLLRRKEQDFVKVVDFGISKSLRASGEEEEAPRLTQTGMVLGTPLYMSPEQARGDDELDHRVDIYALGVIMYEAATGRVPYIGNNYLSVISQVLNEECKPPRAIVPELSEEFEAIVMRAMSKDKHDRYESTQEMLADIATVLDDPTHSTERAKITGPRRKIPKKSSLKVAVWAGSIALIVIALLLLVNFTMGGSPVKKRPVVVPPDAGVATVDAAMTVPADATVEQFKMVALRIVTVPPGATIIKDGVPQSDITPATVDIVDKEKDVKFILQLDGYNEHEFSVNPKEKLPKDNKFTFTLKKPAKGEPIRQTPRIPPAGGGSGSGASTGSAARPPDPTGGELGGNPLRSGSAPVAPTPRR
ncbi:MAG TPA: serine/threonine-protein kinase [Kofleriaceae bacterium]|nr:serine/threonine-protein kinase [Kofleriaceae bacterium]